MAGAELASAQSGSANLFSNFDLACASIMECAEACFNIINLSSARQFTHADCVLMAGCAGAGVTQARDDFEKWDAPFHQKFVTTDLHIACAAANNLEDCALLILGTGSSIAHLKSGQCRQYGGHGFLLGDYASGAWLGKQALKKTLLQFDGLENDEVFTNTILQSVAESTADGIVHHFAHAPPHEFAKLAPVIFKLARSNNKSASQLVHKACSYIEDILKANHLSEGGHCYVHGGLADSYLMFLQSMSDISFKHSTRPSELGAYLLAKQQIINSIE